MQCQARCRRVVNLHRSRSEWRQCAECRGRRALDGFILSLISVHSVCFTDEERTLYSGQTSSSEGTAVSGGAYIFENLLCSTSSLQEKQRERYREGAHILPPDFNRYLCSAEPASSSPEGLEAFEVCSEFLRCPYCYRLLVHPLRSSPILRS